MENIVQEAAPKYNYISPKEYLQKERASDEKHEYFDGQVYLMSGAGLRHTKVATNLIGNLFAFLKDKDCNVLAENMRVSSPSHDSYMYPDVMIVCGKEELEDEQFDTLLNPSVIIEILSPSTRSIDKGRKMMYYKEIPSLKEYFMVDTFSQIVHCVRKQSSGDWRFETIAGNNSIVLLETIQFQLPLSAIYNGTGI
ncbi:MAG: Uma2 family endonuclease [Chitinophagaceae bacterium]|nr:Uma2 family endonuclease [Chitinophagaceae bacterium]